MTNEVLLCSKTDALAEDLLSPAHTLLRSLKAAAVVATAFTPLALPVPTSAAAVISSEVAAASAVVAGAAADILSAAAVSGSAAAIKADVSEVAAAVLSAADDFSATVVAAAAVITPAAAVQAAVVAETDMLQDDEVWFLLSIQASLLFLARSLRLLLGGRFFLPCL